MTADRPELLGTKLFDLTGRAALVTGAGRGLGRMIALGLAAAGADVAVSSRTSAELESLCAEIRGLGRFAVAITADVTEEASCEALVAGSASALGRLDILVNNAGINIRKPVLELSAEEWDLVIATNLRGYFLCARAAGRLLVNQGHGKVINLSSIMGRVALPRGGAYAASKGGVEQLTKALALEWATSGVQVNALAPTYFETDLTRELYDDAERREFITARTPMGRWGRPHEVVGAAIFLASAASDFVTGQTLLVDGGWTAW